MADAFQHIVATIDPPMFIVTAFDGHERDGCLVGFATQCSIHPPRFFVCLSDKNRTTRIAARAEVLVVHVPRARDRQLAEIFGGETGDEVDKFAQCAWHEGPRGTPVLDDCDWFAGTILERRDLGDHIGHLLDVTDAAQASAPSAQLGFQSVREMEPGHEA